MTGAVAARRCPQCGALPSEPGTRYCEHDGSLLERLDPTDPRIGMIFAGKYRITGKLGHGGMGVVYMAEHIHMRREVALKLLRRELLSDETMAARFRREARAASRIDSPLVVTLHDFGEAEDGTLFIAMERLRGETLGARLDRAGPMSPLEAVDHAAMIAQALDAAHGASVVHRDLKPDNVMLTDGRLKVLDFSIAKIVEDAPVEDADAALTHVRSVIGTACYMSPEAVARKPVGPAADLYALGVMLFEMLVGRPPFDDPEPVLLMGMHLRVPPERLREARPDLAVPDALEDLVDALLEKKPEQRPESAAAVAKALAAVRDEVARPSVPRTISTTFGTTAGARKTDVMEVETGAPTTTTRRSRVRLLSTVAGLGLLALIVTGGALVATSLGSPTSEPSSKAARAPRTVVQDDMPVIEDDATAPSAGDPQPETTFEDPALAETPMDPEEPVEASTDDSEVRRRAAQQRRARRAAVAMQTAPMEPDEVAPAMHTIVDRLPGPTDMF